MTNNSMRCLLIPLLVVAMLSHTVQTLNADEPLVFISSFAAGDKGAIHAYQLETTTGALKPIQKTGDVENPFFLAVSRDQKSLYSIHAKTFGGKDPEQVASYAIEGRNGRLKLLNRQSTRGTASCYLDVDATGKTVLVANYSTGNIASLPVNADGSLGEAVSFFQHAGSSVDPARQKGPYAHCIVVSPDNRFAFVADLGLDQVLSYRLEAATAKLSPNTPPFVKAPPGAGPRHLTFHPNGKHVYVINELKNSVTVFDYVTESGTLTERQTISTLPSDFAGTSHCADLKITPDGRFLYGTNRGHDSIATYRIGDDGRLTLIGIEPSLGKGPQNLLIAANGTLLLCANMPGNNVAVFRIDVKTGGLKSVGEPTSILSPSCIRLLP
jgi:6-phosphogluconolactonase